MKYTDLSINLGFYRNMRETNWLKLFPHWWSANDPLIRVIGEEVEHLKANAIFDLLNAGIKPPVLLWQNSLVEEEYHKKITMKNNTEEVVISAPRYKTWGKIVIQNNSKNEIYNFKIMLNENNGLSFNEAFAPNDTLTVDLTNQRYFINKTQYTTPEIYGEGLPYYKISQYEEEYNPKNKLHNEVIRLNFSTSTIIDDLNLDIDIQLDNVVFEDEQNIEITSFELLPMDKVEVYVNYELPYNIKANGWQLAYTKEYEEGTHVIYDMITIHKYTKQFYVEVWFKGLDFPYQVGFPCWKNEEEGSMFHINTRLDTWGELLGLPRRIYKEDIPEEEYYKTFPRYYPFDIEQDFWYYSRLVNEYAWNDLAIDTANIVDTNDDLVMRLHCIDPFVEDFAIHARSYYPTNVENFNNKTYNPKTVDQVSSVNVDYKEVAFEDSENILKCDNNPTTVTLHSNSGYAINNMTNRSKQLKLHYNLSTLPKDIEIDKIEFLIDAEATDNNSDKYNDERTYIEINDKKADKIYPLLSSELYELKRKTIVATIKEEEMQNAWNKSGNRDLRDYLYQNGLDFNLGFTNVDVNNIPTIFIYCIQLKVYYTPKKSQISLETNLLKSTNQYLDIGTLQVKITNIGDKAFVPKCYFFAEENIQLGANAWQPFEDIKVGESQTVDIPIYHNLPIVDGTYEILTICEDKKKFNYVHVQTSGLIETSIKIDDYYIKYFGESNIEATISSVNKAKINKGIISFYVDGVKVGYSNVHENKGSINFDPSQYNITNGFHTLEARYIDYQNDDNEISEYAPARNRSSLLIATESTKTTILSKKYGFTNATYDLIAKTSLLDSDEIVDRGTITFYLDDEEIGTFNIDTNLIDTEGFQSRILFKNKKAGEYKLLAIYNDNTGKYAYSEDEITITLYGGETETITFDIDSYPGGTIYFKAHVQQLIKSMENRKYSIPKIYDDFTFTNANTNKVTFYLSSNLNNDCQEDVTSLLKIGSADLNDDGNCILQYQISNDFLPNDINTKKYKIIAYYEGLDIIIDEEEISVFNPSCDTSILTVSRVNTAIKCLDTFVASQHESLGFYITVVDENNERVNQGTVKLFIPNLNIELESPVQSDGSVVLLYHPVEFTDYEWSILEKITFDIRDPPHENLYRIYDGDIREDLNILDFELRGEDLYYKRQSKSSEQVWIDNDGCLYARTDFDDIQDKIKQYKTGHHTVNIEYTNNIKYSNCNKTSYLDINSPLYDVDIHSHDLNYIDETPIRAWITHYNFVTNENKPKNDGVAYFFIDGVFIDKVTVNNGLAILPRDSITTLSSNKHLISVEYSPSVKGQNRTYAYNMLTMNKAHSSIDAHFDYILKDYDSILTIQISTLDKNVLYGLLKIYIESDGKTTLYDSKELKASIDEGLYYCHMHIPKDIDEKEYNVRIIYEGNEYVESSVWTKKIELEKLPVNITTEDISIISNFKLTIPIQVEASNDDDINEGRIVLYDGDKIVGQGNVSHNIAYVSFTTKTNKEYIVKYEDGINYCNNDDVITLQKINIINERDNVFVSNVGSNGNSGDRTHPFKTLQHAVNCVKEEGNIYILEDCTLKENTIINKKVNIIGENDVCITKDLDDLLHNVDGLRIHHLSEFDNELFKIDIPLERINKQEFKIIKNELYYIEKNRLIPIYLLDDGDFYSYNDIPEYTEITLDIEAEAYFKNIHFKSLDNTEFTDLVINNKDILNMNYCIIDKNVVINSNDNQLNINYSLCYGVIKPNIYADLSFNWWGHNEVNYKDNIVLSLDIEEYPPTIGSDFNIVAKMLGKNGRKYDIPPVRFTFYSDCEGYFQNPTGYILNQELKTTYTDAIKEGEIYIKVDDEIISTHVYDYDYKTEVILDNAKEIPINYQVPIHAKVQSCADTFYKFNKDGSISKQSNDINDGYVMFYLNDMSIGHADVVDGMAEINIYLNSSKYNINDTYTLRADYIGTNHFKSTNTQKLNIISESKVCYVSPDGLNTNNGTFLSPVQSLKTAIDMEHAECIYLKPGIYKDNNIVIERDVKIKSYENDVIFTDSNDDNIIIFNIIGNHNVELEGLHFLNNHCNHIINNNAKLTIKKCVFADNVCNSDILNYESRKLNIYNSVLLDRPIVSSGIKIDAMKYCWFGTNDTDNIITNYNINDYIIMDFKSNKENIYIGTIAQVKSTLLNYKHNNEIYTFTDELPLRVSIFESDSGSLMPIHDYTHNNYSISLFNTNDNVNTQQISLIYKNTTNYYNQPLLLECKVEKFNGAKINEGTAIFTIEAYDEVYTLKSDVNNGIAKVYDENIVLGIGSYKTKCTYNNISVDATLNIKNSSIHINYLDIDEGNHLNRMNISCDNIINSIGNTISNQEYNIYIDNEIIYNKYGTTNFYIKNGRINESLYYPLKKYGYHTITITTRNVESNYNTLNYKQRVLFYKKQTSIDFPYNKIQQNYQSDLKFNIYDEDENSVLFGHVDVYLNNELIYKSVQVHNGLVTLEDFVIEEKGRHTISIYYTGDTEHYESSLYIDNKINVGLYEVTVDEENILNQLKLNIMDNIDLSFYVRNMNHDKIKIGVVNLYIDDRLLNEDSSIKFNDEKKIKYTGKLPNGIIPGVNHKFTIEYIDNTNTYMDTTFDFNFTVSKIPTQIIINPIVTGPNKIYDAAYTISSSIGDVSTGLLSAYLDDICIGEINLSSSSEHKIPLNIPLTLEDKNIKFYYIDKDNKYENSNLDVMLNIQVEKVKIDVSHQWYYPNKEFNFDVTVKDQNDKIIKDGEITLYIDGIKETDSQNIINGYTSFDLIFNKVKTYPIKILFSGNQYYKDTDYPYDLTIQKIPIEKISFDKELKAQPNSEFICNVLFDVFEDYNITDGIINFNLNGENINQYYVTENNKEIKLDIPNLSIGTYDLEVQYYDSLLFTDYHPSKAFSFDILPLPLDMNMEDITAELNDTISIKCNVNPSIKGVIKYYIGIDENNLEFIGVQEINKAYEYTLSKDVLEDSDTYIIVAKFEGNNQYEEQQTTASLSINKKEPTLNISPINDAYYQSTIDINATTNIQGSPMFDIYRITTLSDNQKSYDYIDSVVGNNGEINYKYQLPAKFTKGYYTFALKYNGSSVIDEIEKEVSFNIIPDIPHLKTQNINVYKGNNIKLENILYDINEINIKNGYLEYYYNDDLVLTVNRLNQDEYLYLDVDWSKTNDTLKMKYISENENKYQSSEYIINIVYLKNDINIELDTEDKKTRGEEISLNLKANSKTTLYDIDVPFTYEIGNTTNNDTFKKNHISLLYELEPLIDNFVLNITTEETDIFNSFEKSFVIDYYNRDKIYVSNKGKLNNIGTEDKPTLTLEQALKLLSNNGEIIILTDLESEDITIDKNISLKGDNNNTLTNINIENDAKIKINNLTFNGSSITNNNSSTIKDCTFNDMSKIINNNHIDISMCTFNDNKIPIEITSTNKYALIDNCIFNNNNSDLYGSAIYSKQGNELIIQNSTFTDNKGSNSNGSCIAIYGKANINHNSFAKNKMYTNIYLLNGEINVEGNVFDGNNKALRILKGEALINMNYWGYNAYNNIIEECIDSSIDNITMNTWLISNCKVEKFEDGYKVYPIILQYYNKEENGKIYNTTNIPSLMIEYNNIEYLTNQDFINMENLSNITIGKENIEVKYDK